MIKKTMKYTVVLMGGMLMGLTAFPGYAGISADPEHLERLFNTRECRNCDLSRGTLGARDLSGADVSGANLTGIFGQNVNFSKGNFIGIRASGAEFDHVNFSDANLRGANLSKADLTSAILSDADLTGAVLIQAELSHANMLNAKVTKEQLKSAKSICGAILPDGTIGAC